MVKNNKQAPPSHYAHELPMEEEERLEKLFKGLDVDGNGRIDINELRKAVGATGVHKGYAQRKPSPAKLTPEGTQKFMEYSDKDKSGDVTLAEFIHYMKEHEKKLKLVFSKFDRNQDGKIDLEELKRAFKDLGVDIDSNEAMNLLQRMDQDGTLEISYDEWRDYLLYAPSTDLRDLLNFWRHSTYLDIGEDMNVPDDFTQAEMITGMWWRHLVSGGFAGAVSRTCTAPLDRLKVFLQVHGSKKNMSIMKCLNGMLQEGGVASLWRGNGINVLKIAPESALKFMAYEQAKRLIRRNSTRDLSIYERFVAGSTAGGFSQTVIYPLEVLKTRLALRKTGQYKGILDAAKHIYSKEGWRGFYRGYVPNLLGIVPYAGIDLAVYETLKNMYLRQHMKEQNPGVMLLLLCGTVSSTCGQIASYPLALIRTRLQAQAVLTSVSHAQTLTMTSLVRTILHDEGVTGLYRGITPNFMKVVPAVSISYVVYEHCRQALGCNMT